MASVSLPVTHSSPLMLQIYPLQVLRRMAGAVAGISALCLWADIESTNRDGQYAKKLVRPADGSVLLLLLLLVLPPEGSVT